MCVLAILGVAALLVAGKPWSTRQDKAHKIADLAREMGCPEDSMIIREASVLWWAETDECRILANVIAHEAPYCSDRHQDLVAAVVLNRVADPGFQNSVREVVEQVNTYRQADGSNRTIYQYHPTYTQNLPEFHGANAEMKRCFLAAARALQGEVECPANVLYQSNYPSLGAGNYETIYVDTGSFRSVTYFNYG